MTAVMLWVIGIGGGWLGLLDGAPSVPTPQDPFVRQVELAALEVARGQVLPPDRFEVESVRFNGGVAPAKRQAYRLELAQADGPNASGMFRLRFRVTVDGVPRSDARATVRGRVRGPALVGTRSLVRGSPIDVTNVAVVDADLTRLATAPLRQPEEASGLVPLRTLGEGRVLIPNLLRPAPLVRAGDTVDLFFEKDRLTVRVEGRVRAAGRAGEIVTVENTSSGATLLGEIQADGSLIVTRGTNRRRF